MVNPFLDEEEEEERGLVTTIPKPLVTAKKRNPLLSYLEEPEEPEPKRPSLPEETRKPLLMTITPTTTRRFMPITPTTTTLLERGIIKPAELRKAPTLRERIPEALKAAIFPEVGVAKLITRARMPSKEQIELAAIKKRKPIAIKEFKRELTGKERQRAFMEMIPYFTGPVGLATLGTTITASKVAGGKPPIGAVAEGVWRYGIIPKAFDAAYKYAVPPIIKAITKEETTKRIVMSADDFVDAYSGALKEPLPIEFARSPREVKVDLVKTAMRMRKEGRGGERFLTEIAKTLGDKPWVKKIKRFFDIVPEEHITAKVEDPLFLKEVMREQTARISGRALPPARVPTPPPARPLPVVRPPVPEVKPPEVLPPEVPVEKPTNALLDYLEPERVVEAPLVPTVAGLLKAPGVEFKGRKATITKMPDGETFQLIGLPKEGKPFKQQLTEQQVDTFLKEGTLKPLVKRGIVEKPLTMVKRVFVLGGKEARQNIYKKIKSAEIETAEIKSNLVDYAKERLELPDRGKLLARLRDVKTKRQLARAMQMVDVMEERYQRREAVGNLKKTISDIEPKRMRPEYRKEMESLVTDVDLVNRREFTINRLNRMRDFIATHPDNNIPPEKVRQLEILTRKKVKDLTTDDINTLDNTIKHFNKLHDLKNKMLVGRIYRDANEVKSKAVKNIERKAPQERDPNVISETEKPLQVGPVRQLFTTQSYNAELLTEILDKEKHGAIKEVLYNGIDEGTSEQLRYRHEAEDYFKDKIKFDLSNWSEKFHAKPSPKNVDYQTVRLPSGKTIKFTKATRVSLYLHSLNEKNLRHLFEGGFSFEKTPFVIHKFAKGNEAKELNAIIASMTPEERQLADTVHSFFNDLQKRRLNEISVELNGWEIATEPDYYPIRTNALDRKRDELKMQKNFLQLTLEGMGMLKERTNARNAIILEDVFSTVFKSMKKSSAYYGLAKPLRNAKMLLNDKAFQQKIVATYGKHYLQALKGYLKDVEGNSYSTELAEKMTLDLINKIDVAVLGFNPWVMAKQFVSYFPAATEIDAKYLAQAIAPESIEVMSRWSSQLRDRFAGNVTRELGEIGQAGMVRKFWTGKTALSQKLMAGIRQFDYQAIGRIWKAVELETGELHPELTGDAKMRQIAKRAEEIVRLTQPTFNLKDRSAIGRSHSAFIRLITKYTSQRNKNYMMVRRAKEKYDRSGKTPKDKATLVKSLALLMLLSPLMIWGIDSARNIAYKRKPPKKPRLNFVLSFLENNLSYVYFVGPAFRSLRSKIERGTYAGYDISDVLTSTAQKGVNAIADLYAAIDQAMSQERYKSGDKRGEMKWKFSMLRFLDRAASVTSKIKGVPYDTLRSMVKGIRGWAEEEGKKPPIVTRF